MVYPLTANIKLHFPSHSLPDCSLPSCNTFKHLPLDCISSILSLTTSSVLFVAVWCLHASTTLSEFPLVWWLQRVLPVPLPPSVRVTFDYPADVDNKSHYQLFLWSAVQNIVGCWPHKTVQSCSLCKVVLSPWRRRRWLLPLIFWQAVAGCQELLNGIVECLFLCIPLHGFQLLKPASRFLMQGKDFYIRGLELCLIIPLTLMLRLIGVIGICLLFYELHATLYRGGNVVHGCWEPLLLVLSAPAVKYAHRSLNISDTGLSSFQCAYGLQPPLPCLFANLDLSLNVPAACCGLLPAPTYHVSQKVQLPTRDLPLTVESK